MIKAKIEKNPKNGTSSIVKSKKKKQKNPLAIPRTTPQIIRLFFKDYDEKNNIIKIDDEKYSACFEYTDISFSKASYERLEFVFLKYVDFLNSLNEKVSLQVIHTGLPVATSEYKENFIFNVDDSWSDNKKKIGKELNELIEANLGHKKHTYCEKRLLVIMTEAENFDEAKDIFFQYQLKIEEKFKLLKSKVRRWTLEELFQLLYNTFNKNPYVQEHPHSSILNELKSFDGTIYDYIAPKEPVSFKDARYIKIGEDKYVSVLYASNFPISITPRFYNTLTSLDTGNIIVTENITPTKPTKVINKINKNISGMKTERVQKVKRARKNGYDYELVMDEKLEEKLASTQELRNALQKKKQKLFMKNILVVITAENLKELEEIKRKIVEISSENLITISTLNWQQLEGVLNALPFGINNLQFQRTMISEATATSTPFNTKTLCHPNSIWYGMDLVSRNILSADRKQLMNGNGCVLATSGAGKSFITKITSLEEVLLRYPEDELAIVDPQGEYTPIVEALGGQVVKISTTANTYINPFDLSLEYVDDNNDPIKTKTEYILAFMESIVGRLSGEQKSIVDRCTKFLYEGIEGNVLKPTFPSFYKILTSFKEAEANNLALILERYVNGGMDIFSKETNIEINNRLISFDLSDLTKSMQTTGYLVVLEHIMNRLSKNKKDGHNTWINIDEFHILLENQYSAEYIARIYKIGRKLGAIPTIITQNIEDVLKSEQGRKILSNSEFALILRQKPLDISPICKIFGVSDEESEYVTNSPPGQGLLIYGEDVVPFRLIVPTDYYIYKLNETSLMQATVRD